MAETNDLFTDAQQEAIKRIVRDMSSDTNTPDTLVRRDDVGAIRVGAVHANEVGVRAPGALQGQSNYVIVRNDSVTVYDETDATIANLP